MWLRRTDTRLMDEGGRRGIRLVGFGFMGAVAGVLSYTILIAAVLMLRMLTGSDGEFLGSFFDEFVFVLAWALPVGLPIVGAVLGVTWSRQRHRGRAA
jgi:hypothetical protein